jgi:predicted RNA-binding Zn-ribbon protein involved in translation (DUF1610 family)
MPTREVIPMTLTRCSECGAEISDQALACPQCGKPATLGRIFGYEYRSEATLLGLPLLHVATGIDPATGRRRVAKGIIAVGDVAVGLFALGGLAAGGVTLGGCSLGLISLGGLAIGLVFALGGAAVGGIALGGAALGVVAIGGGAVGYYALGGGAWGMHVLSATGRDPEAVEFYRQWFPWLVNAMLPPR